MSKSAQRRASYRLMLHETFHISYIVDVKQASRVNNNRKRARIDSIAKNRKTGGCSDKNYPFRRKTFRKEVAQMWRQTFSRRQIKMLAKIGEIVYSGKKWDFTDNVKSR